MVNAFCISINIEFCPGTQIKLLGNHIIFLDLAVKCFKVEPMANYPLLLSCSLIFWEPELSPQHRVCEPMPELLLHALWLRHFLRPVNWSNFRVYLVCYYLMDNFSSKDWCPQSWKSLFNIFCFVFVVVVVCLFAAGRRVTPVLVTLFWLEEYIQTVCSYWFCFLLWDYFPFSLYVWYF